MKQEINPIILIGAIAAVVIVAVLIYWRTSVPEGVRTSKPPRVPPPGAGAGMPREAGTPPGGAAGTPGRGMPPGGAPVGPGSF